MKIAISVPGVLAAAWALLALPAWGQGEAEGRRLGIEWELGFFAASAPELSLTLAAEGEGFRAQLNVTRSLEQTPRWKLALSESLEIGGYGLSAEAGWEASRYSLELGAQAQAQDAQVAAQLKLNSLGSATWALQGQMDLTSRGLPLRGKLARLEWGWGRGQVRIQGLELLWEPTPSRTMAVRYESARPLPLEVEIRQAFPQGLEAAGKVRLAPGREVWAWQELELQLAGDGLSGSALFAPEGWRGAWIERLIPLMAPGERGGFMDGSTLDLQKLEIWGRLHLGPEGWRGTELGGRWEDPLKGALEGTVDFSPDGWGIEGNGRYLSSSLTLQGRLGFGPAGLSQLLLLGQGSLEALSVNGLFQRTGTLWLLDVSGAVDFGTWAWSAASSWSSPLGWERATLGISREILLKGAER